MIAYYLVYPTNELEGPFFHWGDAVEFGYDYGYPLLIKITPKIRMNKSDWPLHTVDQDEV